MFYSNVSDVLDKLWFLSVIDISILEVNFNLEICIKVDFDVGILIIM